MIYICLGHDDQVVSCFTVGKAYGCGTFPKCKVTLDYLLPPLKLLLLGMLAPSGLSYTYLGIVFHPWALHIVKPKTKVIMTLIKVWKARGARPSAGGEDLISSFFIKVRSHS
jgi:hypothetical protein